MVSPEAWMRILDTLIQYSVLGVLGFIAIRIFISLSKENSKQTKELFDFLIKTKCDEYKEIKDALSIIIKSINKQNQNLVKYKYDIAVQFQLLISMVKDIDIKEEKMDEIVTGLKNVEISIIKTIEENSEEDKKSDD